MKMRKFRKLFSLSNCSLVQFLMLQLLGILTKFLEVDANFNFFLHRREFQKLHGISSDIYYVREGVVNEYATSFLVTVPAEVDDLNFSWQALNKRPINYEMTIDYTDFFALSPPYCNISKSGRVPQNLEVFRVSLPCSGRSNAEVSVTIKITFQVKHPKPNSTTINIKRNKICLLRETTQRPVLLQDEILSPSLQNNGDIFSKQEQDLKNGHIFDSKNGQILKNGHILKNGNIFLGDPTPSLLLASLLGGCIVTASLVFLIFFICLKKKLSSAPSSQIPQKCDFSNSYIVKNGSNSSTNSSPACLLRQPQNYENWEKNGTFSASTNRTEDSHNSYVTVASFWNDIFSSRNNTNNRTNNENIHGSDVSPYAYAQILPQVPKIGAPQWYSQNPSQNILNQKHKSSSFNKCPNSSDKIGHIYANSLYSFNPKSGPTSSKLIKTHFKSSTEQLNEVGKNTSTLKSTTGSLVQIDGFQCRRNFTKEDNVVERFL